MSCFWGILSLSAGLKSGEDASFGSNAISTRCVWADKLEDIASKTTKVATAAALRHKRPADWAIENGDLPINDATSMSSTILSCVRNPGISWEAVHDLRSTNFGQRGVKNA